MRRFIISVCVPLLAALPAAAVVNPYVDPITTRNMFGLKAPPTAEELAAMQPPKPAEPLPKVWLTGITTLMGGKMALLRVQRLAKPPEPAKEIPLILAENAPAEEEVQVLEINVAAGTVKISNRGTPQELDITKDSPKAAAAPPAAPGAVPGLRPGLPIPMPAGAVPAPGTGIPIPPRPVRGAGPGTGTDPSNNTGAQTQTAPAASGGWSGSGIGGARVEAPHISPEEQTIMIEAQRLQGGPEAVILPPTELTEVINQENNPNPSPSPGPQPPF